MPSSQRRRAHNAPTGGSARARVAAGPAPGQRPPRLWREPRRRTARWNRSSSRAGSDRGRPDRGAGGTSMRMSPPAARAARAAATVITLALLATACTAAAPGGQPGAPPARPALTGAHPCPGQAGFTCSYLAVPLDRSGKVPGMLRLQVAAADNVRRAAGHAAVPHRRPRPARRAVRRPGGARTAARPPRLPARHDRSARHGRREPELPRPAAADGRIRHAPAHRAGRPVLRGDAGGTAQLLHHRRHGRRPRLPPAGDAPAVLDAGRGVLRHLHRRAVRAGPPRPGPAARARLGGPPAERRPAVRREHAPGRLRPPAGLPAAALRVRPGNRARPGDRPVRVLGADLRHPGHSQHHRPAPVLPAHRLPGPAARGGEAETRARCGT